MATYPGNYNYLRDVLDIHPSTERFAECLAAMEKYETPWWYQFKAEPTKLAAMQLNEPVLLVGINTFRKGIQKVCGRQIEIGEISFRNQALKDEFIAKYVES